MTPERPRVLHLTTTDISLELLLGPQLEAFAAAGYDVHAASAAGPFVDAVERRGVTFHPLEHSTRAMSPLDDLRAAREFFGLIGRLRPTIVHTHNPKPGVYGRVTAGLRRVPGVVNTVHGLYAQPSDPLAKRTVVYGLERLAAVFSDVELVQNPEDVAVLRRLRIPERRLRLLGNGVDLGRFRPDADHRTAVRAELGLAPDDVVVGAVGRLVAEKGYLELFEAWRTVAATHAGARLVIAGPHEPDKADGLTGDMVREAEASGVVLLGHRSDVERLYPALDVYVLASHREGFPRSAMEAAATGVALVLTDIRGCRQVVSDDVDGLLVPPRDPSALTAALDRLVGDADLRARLGRAALRKATAEFDQQRVIDRTLREYERLAPVP